jgi:hypothetical protein
MAIPLPSLIFFLALSSPLTGLSLAGEYLKPPHEVNKMLKTIKKLKKCCDFIRKLYYLIIYIYTDV